MKIFFMNTKENSPLHFSHYLLQIYLTGMKLFIILIAALPSLPISSLSWWLILSVKCGENHHNKRTGKIWSRTLIPLVRETSKHITCLLSMFIYIFLFSYFFFFFSSVSNLVISKTEAREKELWWPLLQRRTKNGQGESLFTGGWLPCLLKM